MNNCPFCNTELDNDEDVGEIRSCEGCGMLLHESYVREVAELKMKEKIADKAIEIIAKLEKRLDQNCGYVEMEYAQDLLNELGLLIRWEQS